MTAVLSRTSPLAAQNPGDAYTSSACGQFSGLLCKDGWFGFSGTRPDGGKRPYIERAEFPQVVEMREGGTTTTQLASYTPCSACSMTIDGTDFYVLFGGRTDNRHAVLDRYDLRNGRYRESLVLPAKTTEAAVAGGTFFLLVEEPAPTLLALRPLPPMPR